MEASEVGIKIRASQVDQSSRGEWRNHSRIEGAQGSAADEHTCAVEAPTLYEGWARERFPGARTYNPLFAYDDERLVRRADAQRIVMQSAAAEGADPNGLGSHSLQSGGASALYAAFEDTARVQRQEMWNSEIFHDHPREARDRAQGVASITAASDMPRA